MATGFGAAGANAALDALLTAYPWVQLHIGSPGANGTGNPALETTRKQATFAPGVAGASSNTSELLWTAVTATETYTHCSLWSAATAGSFGCSGTITATQVSAGANARLQAGQLTISIPLAS